MYLFILGIAYLKQWIYIIWIHKNIVIYFQPYPTHIFQRCIEAAVRERESYTVLKFVTRNYLEKVKFELSPDKVCKKYSS